MQQGSVTPSSVAHAGVHNPRYAGAYVLGRTQQRTLGNGRRLTRQLAREEWAVLLPDAHEGYISWEEFEENQRRLRANNWRTRSGGGTTPPREGSALLQGVALCGVCGRRMVVRYGQRQGRRVPYYRCYRGPQRFPGDKVSGDSRRHHRRVVATCGSIRTTVWWPIRWKPTGTTSCGH